jgi:hypothetical protein
MTLFEIVAILLSLSAVFSYINARFGRPVWESSRTLTNIYQGAIFIA